MARDRAEVRLRFGEARVFSMQRPQAEVCADNA